MPYKIYTYEDPYKLDQTDFWEEISGLPHFCAARTLTNGLISVYGDGIKGLICPLDSLVGHEQVFKAWTDNIGLRIRQYRALSAYFKDLVDRRRISENFHQALTQNQNHFLEAIRLLIELGLSPEALDKTKGSIEQRLFSHILKKAHRDTLFRFPETPSREKLRSIIAGIAQQETEECTGTRRERERCKQAAQATARAKLDAIVIHGVHRFSPVQLRLLMAMEEMGVTIIFLFNYQKKFAEIYSSWIEIYDCFETPIHHDTYVQEYQMPTMQNPSNALACALAALGRKSEAVAPLALREWHKLYRNIELIKFANITEYAHFVSDRFDAAISKYSESRGIVERGNDAWNNAVVLAHLDEQIYTSNRDVHTLLKIYYPEYAKDRHFLAYPIGQFFSAIYRLWDCERDEIIFDVTAIKECLSSNLLKAGSGEVLLRTFCNVEILFEQITTFSDFQHDIENAYLENYSRVNANAESIGIGALKQLSIYNKYKATKRDIAALLKAIAEINEIAKSLFSQGHSRESFVDFGEHFRSLEKFLLQRESDLVNEQERALITALQLRLDKVKPGMDAVAGTLRDLQEGLYYYLKLKNDDQGVDWIVKNFEQIDGDILQSKRQFEQNQQKVYHFACLSDCDMNRTINDQLPWPLTEEYIREAYAPVDLQFQVYYTALGERSSFLRYALFYGLCFNRCDVRLSFVEQYGEEATELYTSLSVLGIKPKAGLLQKDKAATPYTITLAKEKAEKLSYRLPQMMDMLLCPYRYFLEYVLEAAPVVQGSFLYHKYYENLLVDAVWKRIEKKPCADALRLLPQLVDGESRRLEPYFSFWKSTEFDDLKLRARNYLEHGICNDTNGRVKPYDPKHMQIRKQFGAAKFFLEPAESAPRNPYQSFEALSKVEAGKKTYSLHALSGLSPDKQAGLCREMEKYINQEQSADKAAIASAWCIYCTHRGQCTEGMEGAE